jgi:hypothetical protein
MSQNIRFFLWASILFVGFLLYNAWQQDTAKNSPANNANIQNSSTTMTGLDKQDSPQFNQANQANQAKVKTEDKEILK